MSFSESTMLFLQYTTNVSQKLYFYSQIIYYSSLAEIIYTRFTPS